MNAANTSLTRFYEAITGPSQERLQDVRSDVVANLDAKNDLRAMKKKVAELKAAIASGDHERAGELVAELRDMARRAGYAEDSSLMAMLDSVDPAGLSARTSPFTEEEERTWTDFLDRLSGVIDLELEDKSDLTQLQQIEVNTAYADLRRSEQTMSDILKTYNNAARTAVQNLKA